MSCKKKKEEEKEEEPDFDKTAMLTNYADNVIIPNLVMAKRDIDSLTSKFNQFNINKDLSNLNSLRSAYFNAYVSFQHITTYELGPSETEIIRSSFNTYPTDTIQINANITAGSYDLTLVANTDAKGLPALDYLLYGKGISDSVVLSNYTTAIYATNRLQYLQTCIYEMQTKINNVINGWNTGYRSTFINSTGSGIGSSLGLLVNQLNFEVDLLKNNKIGIPLGKKSLGVALPDKCEAYYRNTISIHLAKECLNNIENDYLGRSYLGSDGSGMDDYLDALGAQHTSGSLNSAIKSQFVVAKSKLALVQEPLSTSVTTDVATVDAAYIEIQKLLVLLKTDMTSAMGIVITYQDSDGD